MQVKKNSSPLVDLKELKKRRLTLSLSQKEVAEYLGITQKSFSRYELGQRALAEDVLFKLDKLYSSFEPKSDMEAKFDYFRMRFPTHNVQKIVEEVLLMDFDSFLHEDRGLYGYFETYSFGQIKVMNSEDEKGVLLQMSGEGCRNYEDVLDTLSHNWKMFVIRCLENKGSATRIDVALDDYKEIMSIPEMARKVRKGEYDSNFRTYEIMDSGSSIYNDSEGMTIYFGSKRSHIYFCFYQKNYEIAKKENRLVEDIDVKNRYEVRMADKKARLFLEQYINCVDFGNTVSGVLASYVEFFDYYRISDEYRTSKNWLSLLGKLERIDLTIEPRKVTIDSKINWVRAQVARALKIIETVDVENGTNVLREIIDEAQLSKNDEKMIVHATGTTASFTLEEYINQLSEEDFVHLKSVMEVV